MVTPIFYPQNWKKITNYLKKFWTNYGKNKKGRKRSEHTMNKYIKIASIFTVLVAIALIIAGIVSIWLVEKLAENK